MDKKTEKKIEGKVGKKVAGEIKKEVEKEVKERVEKEVKKKIHEVIYDKTISSALKFKEEFKGQVVIAVSAAFGFLIALSWREPIQDFVDLMINRMGLNGKGIYIEFLSALVITLIAVLGLMWVSRWRSKDS